MRLGKKSEPVHEGDLTPMIDMTFQLIAFFMVLINFAQTEQNDLIKLPESTLAKPPDAPLDYPITLHLKSDGDVVIGGETVRIAGLGPYLSREARSLEYDNKTPSDATVIIRAHQEAPVGRVQELIKVCQENRFDTFALRAKEDVGD